MLDVLLKKKGMSLYQLEKKSGISHSTLNDLYHEKINIDKCSVITLKRIADCLDLSLDKLYKFLNYEDFSYFIVDQNFDLFKSDICHEVKKLKPEKFIEKYINNKEVEDLYKKKQYVSSIYLLSMIDLLCKEKNIPLNKKYEYIRNKKLNKIILPKGIAYLMKTKKIKYDKVVKDCIPLFYKHNIIESEIENVY